MNSLKKDQIFLQFGNIIKSLYTTAMYLSKTHSVLGQTCQVLKTWQVL